MKKFILISSMFVLLWSLELKPYTVSVLVPRDAVSNGTLFVYMHDKGGAELVGKYTLSSHQGTIRSIAQTELEIITGNTLDNALVLEMVSSSNQTETSSYVVVSLEFDESINVIKVLVVKDNFFEDDLFDVLSLSANLEDDMSSFQKEMEYDAISELSHRVESLDIASKGTPELTYYQRCWLAYQMIKNYAYGKLERMISRLYHWQA